MRASQLLLITRRDPPADASTASYGLLVRAGMVRPLGDGVVAAGPLLVRVLRRVEEIARDAFDRIGGQEVRLPLLQPSALRPPVPMPSGETYETQDRSGSRYTIAPPGAAGAAALLRDEVRSYRQLPLLLYQLRPALRTAHERRAELLRAREFLCHEAFTYDLDVDGTVGSLQAVSAVYERIAAACGLEVVRADHAEGAARSIALVVLGRGDQRFAVSSYGLVARLEAARADLTVPPAPQTAPMQEVPTPGATTMAALSMAIPDVPPQRHVKTLLYETPDGAVVAAVCRGDRNVDERKLAVAVGADGLVLAGDAGVTFVTGAAPGYAGPVGLPDAVRLVVDPAAATLQGFVCGANRTDAHLRDVWWGRDVQIGEVADIDRVRPGDPAPDGGTFDLVDGIEVAHLAAAGGDGSDLRVLDDTGAEREVHVGSGRMDLTRLVATVVEHRHDGGVMVWPPSLSPFGVVVVQTRPGDATQDTLSGLLTGSLDAAGCRPLWDDRAERPGVKFHDADLIGAPVRITVGRDAADGQVEVLDRHTGAVQTVATDDAVRLVVARLDGAAGEGGG